MHFQYSYKFSYFYVILKDYIASRVSLYWLKFRCLNLLLFFLVYNVWCHYQCFGVDKYLFIWYIPHNTFSSRYPGNSCCVWCLFQCKMTKPAIRFQLLCVFSLMLTCCVITLPIVTFMYYNNTFCRSFTSPETKFWFSAINSIVLQMERVDFATVALFR